MGVAESPGMSRHVSSNSLSYLDAKKASSLRKRSDIREEEVAQLLAEGRAHIRSREAPPQEQHLHPDMMISRHYNSPTKASSQFLQTPLGKSKTRHNREATTGNSSPLSADWGEEYLHTSTKNTPNMNSYKNTISSPQLSNMVRSRKMDESLPRGRHTYLPRSLSHTRNLSNALKQCKAKYTLHPADDSTSELLIQQLESAAELADMLNQGLRANLEYPTSMHSQNAGSSLNADLHTLLHYSDEQVRHLTEALLALMQEHRAKSYEQDVSCTPRQASRQRSADSSFYTSFSPATGPRHQHSFSYAAQHTPELRGSSRQKVGFPRQEP